MRISPARRIAFDVLRRVEAKGAYASDQLHARLGKAAMPEDAALATELALGVLRWRRLLDFLLERYLERPAHALDLEVLIALRLGLYQLRWLERVPARAAVNESVELVKAARKASAAALVNAVLRRAALQAREPFENVVPRNLSPADRLGIRHSHPTWLVERWLAHVGERRTIALLEANNRAPRLTCIVHDAKRRDDVLTSCKKSRLEVAPGRWLAQALSVRGGNPAASEAFRRGWISIQDEASRTVALALGVERGDSVLDVCAAPGGKTATLARAAGDASLVVASDSHAHRLRAMRTLLHRLGLEHVRLVALDATRPLPFSRSFDRILVDAPCSGTGTLARNPEVRWRLTLDDLGDFHSRQVAMLRQAVKRLAPGGRAVYSTCSLEPEENEEVVRAVEAERPDLRRISPVQALVPHLRRSAAAEKLIDPEGFFRTFPPEQETDGFFAAVLERVP